MFPKHSRLKIQKKVKFLGNQHFPILAYVQCIAEVSQGRPENLKKSPGKKTREMT